MVVCLLAHCVWWGLVCIVLGPTNEWPYRHQVNVNVYVLPECQATRKHGIAFVCRRPSCRQAALLVFARQRSSCMRIVCMYSGLSVAAAPETANTEAIVGDHDQSEFGIRTNYNYTRELDFYTRSRVCTSHATTTILFLLNWFSPPSSCICVCVHTLSTQPVVFFPLFLLKEGKKKS